MASHLSLVGGTDVAIPATPSKPAAPSTALAPPAPVELRPPVGPPAPSLPPGHLVSSTPGLDPLRQLILAAQLRDGRTVRAIIETIRASSVPSPGVADYAAAMLTLMRMGVRAYRPDSSLPAVFAMVDEPRKLLKALNLSKQLKPAHVEGLVLFDEYRLWMSEVAR